ncbi:hypothetical protein [Streptomyces sp. NBC_00120]|uniref:hypothetical protein n=1 Tax=Streptomyces sp. NBC_00120 TaxID=2975660 RepID=UPI00224F57D6|nr:hypothetical protein [Streptomyces sp. NBC_00120]MCX5326336.1 hypothetical protein [Streptomyces sp. NBC_00120]
MPNGTDQQAHTEPPQPTGNRILDEPATAQACQHDYAGANIERHSSEQRDANARRH